MYNYANLSVYEFELLCRDIMEKKQHRENQRGCLRCDPRYRVPVKYWI